MLLAVAAGLGGEAAFVTLVRHSTHAAPIRPPFVTARLVEDGAGMAVLDRRCTPAAFRLCAFRGRLPQPSDTFLWVPADEGGVFRDSSAANQRALAAEQSRFVVAALHDAPGAVLRAAATATGRQFGLWHLAEFDDAAGTRWMAAHVPPAVMATLAGTRAFRGTMPVAGVAVITALAALLGLMLLAWYGLVGDRRAPTGIAAVLVAGWIVNDAICGALSTPHDRYQTRVLWLLVAVAAMLAAQAVADRRRHRETRFNASPDRL